MTDAAAHQALKAPRRKLGSLDFWRKVALWLLVGSAWLVVIEPAPYELIFALTLLLFLPGGLRVPLISLPFITALVLYNLGGAVGLEGATDDKTSVWFTIISYYMAVTGMFFCFLVTTETNSRMAIIRNAYIWAAVIAAVLGIVGYLDIGGLGAHFSRYSRATGTFKDPNVFAPFLVPPLIFLAQDVLLGKARRPIFAVGAILLISLGLLLAFSRGAWGNAVGSALLLVVLTLLVAPDPALRRRIIALSIGGAALLTVAMAIAVQIPAINKLFEVRASLNQSYDVSETGRFANWVASIPIILTQPQGMNPRHFRYIFGADPHNVFVNAFASYGWLGGLTFFTLVIMTFWAGWRTIRVRTPWQHHAIAVYVPLVAVLIQGIQIDTDHWRHLYLLLGCMWGMLGATIAWEGQMRRQNQAAWTSPNPPSA